MTSVVDKLLSYCIKKSQYIYSDVSDEPVVSTCRATELGSCDCHLDDTYLLPRTMKHKIKKYVSIVSMNHLKAV